MGAQVSGLKNLPVGSASAWTTLRSGVRFRNADVADSNARLGAMLGDAFLVLAGYSLVFAAHSLLQKDDFDHNWRSMHDLPFLLIYLGVVGLSCHAHRLYDEVHGTPAPNEIFTIIRAQILAAVLLICIVHISRIAITSPWIVAVTTVINIGTFVMRRTVSRSILARRFDRGCGVRNILIMGASEVGRALANYVVATSELGYRFIGFLDARTDWPQVLGTPEDLAKVVRSRFVDVLFVTYPSDRELVKSVITEACTLNIDVKIVPDLFDGLACNSPIEHFGGFPICVVHRPSISRAALVAKRMVDVAVSAVALLILLPVFLGIALAIRVDSCGPILYRAERVGKKGRRFVCHKFRTMIANADALKGQLQHLNEREGVFFKIREDPRTTRVGRFLRKYSLDELPQFWNVLKGDMSLVGPRPPINSEVEMYSLEHLRRLNVTPGMTGLWQVTARQDPSFETYFALDLEYIETWSPLLDVKLLFRTIPAVLKGTGR